MSSSGMRRRNVAGSSDTGESKTKAALESLKRFDVYAKVDDDYVEKSKAGGVVSMGTAIVLIFLFLVELREFFSVDVASSITVDTRIRQQLVMGLSMTLPQLPCHDMSVDTIDTTGSSHANLLAGLKKIPVNSQGMVIPDQAGKCLPCLEGEDTMHKCCNTCDDLRDAYVAQGLDFAHVSSTAEQCKHVVGCRLEGNVGMIKSGGSFQIVPGTSTIEKGQVIHNIDAFKKYNTSHEIHKVTFGDAVPGFESPLDETSKAVQHGSILFRYYLKLVPSIFRRRDGQELYSNFYTFTDSAANVARTSGDMGSMPGVFMIYDFSPFLMHKAEVAKPWSYIFTSGCAIIGGAFSIARLVELAVTSFIGRAFGRCAPGVVGKV